jgi:hypothetical protein
MILANDLMGNPPQPDMAAVIAIPRRTRCRPSSSSSASGRPFQHDDRQVMAGNDPIVRSKRAIRVYQLARSDMSAARTRVSAREPPLV